MNLHNHPNAWTSELAAIGEPLLRSEDPKLLRGDGRYTDDLHLERQAYCVMVRSRHAHGVIRSIATDTARQMPGVLAVYTGADLSSYGLLKSSLPFKSRDGSDMRRTGRPALAIDKVRYVGDPVACVIAESIHQAKDAAEAIELAIDPLPVVTEPAAAVGADAPQLYDDAPGNLALDFHYGDADKVKAAFAAAAHVTRVSLVNSRVVVNPLEPRGAIGVYDAATGRWTLHVGCQGVMGMKAQLAFVLGAQPDKVHVLSGNVGGSFGMKAAVYPEYVCCLHGARMLGRPVKWTDERSTSFLSDNHGRDHLQTVELALDAEGHFLALRLSEVSTRCVFSNTTFVSPYRGAGRPEGNYFMERVIDIAAAEMGLDRTTLRRRNQLTPRELPYVAASGMTYDSGDFPAVFKQALELADWKGFSTRRREAKKRGVLRGIGVGCYLEVTAPANKEMGGVRFEADGTVTIVTGTLDYGQGHATPFAQVLSEKLGVPFGRIRLLQGDSDALLA